MSNRKTRDKVLKEADMESEKHYQWPPVRDPDLNYKSKVRNPLHSIITALPLIMLVAGLYIYYRGESQQTHGAPIGSQSIELTGTFTGLSATSGRHYLWVEHDGAPKGVRIHAEQVAGLEALERGVEVAMKIAPSVDGSTTYWAWYVEQAGSLYLDAEDTLQ